jgi:hypothetical protein
LPIVSTTALQAVVDLLGDRILPNTGALLPMDRAGRHSAKDLVFAKT